MIARSLDAFFNYILVKPVTFFGSFFVIFTILYATAIYFPYSSFASDQPPFGLTLFFAPWLLLALFSTLADSAVGFIDEHILKSLNREKNPAIDAPGRLVLLSGLFGGVVSFIIVIFLLLTEGSISNLQLNYTILLAFLAGTLEVLWLIPYFTALERGGAINTTPLFQSVPIFSLILGLLFFNEIPLLLHLIAVLIIILGAVLLNYSPTNYKLDSKTVGLMFLSSAIISLGYFLFKDAAIINNFYSAVFYNGLGMFIFSGLIWVTWKPYRQQFNSFIKSIKPDTLKLQISNESLYSVGALANNLALVIGPSVMVVSAIDGFNPLFTLFIALILFKFGSSTYSKSFTKKTISYKVIAIVCITLGALLLSIDNQ